MIPYYLLVILAFLLVFFDFQPSRKIKLVVFSACGIMLFLFAGLRSVGTDNDSHNYEDAYYSVENTTWTDILAGDYEHKTMERSYMLLNKAMVTAGLDVRFLFLLLAALSVGLTLRIIWKRSPFPFSSLLFYTCFFYFYRDFTQIRYAVAAALGMHALFLFIDKKYLPAGYVILAAVFFHSSMLVLFLLVLAYMAIRNYWFYFLLPVAGFLAGLFNPVIFLMRVGGLPPALINYVEQEDLGRGGYVASVISQLLLLGAWVFRGRLLRHYSERHIGILYAALSIGSFINLTFISFSIMQRLSLMLFGVTMFLGMYLFRLLENRPSERYAVLSLQLLFNIYVCYYGLKMIGPEILQPYDIL